MASHLPRVLQAQTANRLRDYQTLVGLPPEVQPHAGQRMGLQPHQIVPQQMEADMAQLQAVLRNYQMQVVQMQMQAERLQQAQMQREPQQYNPQSAPASNPHMYPYLQRQQQQEHEYQQRFGQQQQGMHSSHPMGALPCPYLSWRPLHSFVSMPRSCGNIHAQNFRPPVLVSVPCHHACSWIWMEHWCLPPPLHVCLYCPWPCS